MADFSLAQIGSGVASPTQVNVGPEGPSAIESGLGLLSMLAPSGQQLAARQNQKAQEAAAIVAGNFQQELLKLAEAVDTGELSSQRARMRMRQVYAQYAADNPLLVTDLADIQGKVVSTAGLGKVVAEGTDEEKMQREAFKKADERGWLAGAKTEEERLGRLEAMREFDLNLEILGAEKAKLEYANAEISNQRGIIGLQADRVGLQTSQINQQAARLNLQRSMAQWRVEQSLGSMVSSYGEVFRAQSQDIARRAADPNISHQERAQLQQELALLRENTYGSVIAQMGPGASSESLALITKPLDIAYEFANNVISGQNTLDNIERSIDLAVQAEVLNSLVSDPEARALAAVSNLFGEGVLVHSLGADNISVRAFLRATQGQSSLNLSDEGEVNGYLGMSTRAMEEMSNGRLGPQAQAEVTNVVNATLKAVAERGISLSPQQIDRFVNHFASPQYAKMVESGKVSMDSSASAGASQVFDQLYFSEVSPLIQKAWLEAKRTPSELASGVLGVRISTEEPATQWPREVKVSDAVDFKFSGGGVVFEAKTRDPRVLQAVRGLNKEAAPVINKMIRAGAHLEQHTNYRNYFETNVRGLFESGDEEGNAQ